VLYLYRDLSELLQHYSTNLFQDHMEDIDKLELLCGGDHGKGAFSFLAVIVVRYKLDRDALIMDL
jgi:hypothetical protein